MDHNALQILQLFYSNLGGAYGYLRNFDQVTEYLDEPFRETTLLVIRLLTGDPLISDMLYDEDGYIEAKVRLDGADYGVTVLFPEEGTVEFIVTDDRGKNCTEWYLQTVTRSPEQQDLTGFWRPRPEPARLNRYPGDDRGARRQFIQAFQPVQLLPEKGYWLHLEADGRFSVRLGRDGAEISCLSNAEWWVYHYLCFLQQLHFWDSLQDDPVKVPVLIRDFSDRLDSGTDVNRLYLQAEALGRQVLILEAE